MYLDLMFTINNAQYKISQADYIIKLNLTNNLHHLRSELGLKLLFCVPWPGFLRGHTIPKLKVFFE